MTRGDVPDSTKVTNDLGIETLQVVRASNDEVFSADGRRFIDLFCGAGTALLGHVNPRIEAALSEQLKKVWITGTLKTEVADDARRSIEEFFPDSHRVVGLYSTGMEAAEFALRMARVNTGRKGVVGFAKCMHGKSMATAYLGWSNPLVSIPDFVRLPYVSEESEERILDRLTAVLRSRTTAALFVEPLQGSGGGHVASSRFLGEMARLCKDYGTLCVVDEIFSGFYRTGTAFLHSSLGITPDVVLVGKAMGNGFPVSGVVADRRLSVEPSMFPGSTYAGNPLACAVIVATLSEMKARAMDECVGAIETVITSVLRPVADRGVTMRGKGALWVLELSGPLRSADAAARIASAGVLVSVAGSFLRLLPPATITPENLTHACHVVRDVLRNSRP